MTDELEPIPSYGDLFPFEQFKEMCTLGMLSDYDGHGEWSDGIHILYSPGIHRKSVFPSNIRAGEEPLGSHVVWFNK